MDQPLGVMHFTNNDEADAVSDKLMTAVVDRFERPAANRRHHICCCLHSSTFFCTAFE